MRNFCFTVGQLQRILDKFDSDTPLKSIGPDIGGYDCEHKDEVLVERKGVYVYVGGDNSSQQDWLNRP